MAQQKKKDSLEYLEIVAVFVRRVFECECLWSRCSLLGTKPDKQWPNKHNTSNMREVDKRIVDTHTHH